MIAHVDTSASVPLLIEEPGSERSGRVWDTAEHVTVTRRGRPAAVLVPVDEYEALEETAEILSDEPTLDAIRRGLDDLAAGELVSLDEVRAEHAARDRGSAHDTDPRWGTRKEATTPGSSRWLGRSSATSRASWQLTRRTVR